VTDDYNKQYSVVDPILFPWADRHGFKINTEYKGYIVRSIAVPGIPNPGHLGQSAQLWVDVVTLDPQNPVVVNVAIGRWSSKERVSISEFEDTLDRQLSLLRAKGASAI